MRLAGIGVPLTRHKWFVDFSCGLLGKETGNCIEIQEKQKYISRGELLVKKVWEYRLICFDALIFSEVENVTLNCLLLRFISNSIPITHRSELRTYP